MRIGREILKIAKSEQFIKFVISGGTAFVVDFCVLTICLEVLNFNLYVLGIISLANLLSLLCGMTTTFVLNRFWSFKATNSKVYQQGAKFLAVHIFSMIMNSLLFGLLTQYLFVSPYIAKIGVTGLQVIWNFPLYKFFVFRNKGQKVD